MCCSLSFWKLADVQSPFWMAIWCVNIFPRNSDFPKNIAISTFAALDTLLRKSRRMAVSLFAPLSPRMTQFANRYAIWSNRSEDSFWCTSRPRSKPVSSAIARVFTPRRAPASSRSSPVFHIRMRSQGCDGTGDRKHSGLYRGCRLASSPSECVRQWRKQFYNFGRGIIVGLHTDIVAVPVQDRRARRRPPSDPKVIRRNVGDRAIGRLPGWYDFGGLGQHHYDAAALVLQLCPQGDGRHRYCACRGAYWRNWSAALAAWQCRSQVSSFTIDRLDSGWFGGIALEH